MGGVNSRHVALAHDAMALEYDCIEDPWYTHLFAQIHATMLDVAESLGPSRPLRALDVGCGTGFQTQLLADAGFDTSAFDLSSQLLDAARLKEAKLPQWHGDTRFQRDMRSSHERARLMRGGARRGSVRLFAGDANDASCYAGGPYDMIVCCGSVLSFVEDPDTALRAMCAACSAQGRIVIECEMKSNLDLVWPIIDCALMGHLGYEQSWRETWSNLCSLGPTDVETVYPFDLRDGSTLTLPMRLFSFRRLRHRVQEAGLRLRRYRSVHCVTNLIPSTALHNRLNRPWQRVFDVLARLDCGASHTWPLNRLGCSMILELEPAGCP